MNRSIITLLKISLLIVFVTPIEIFGQNEVNIEIGEPVKSSRKNNLVLLGETKNGDIVGINGNHFGNNYKLLSIRKNYLEKYSGTDMRLKFSHFINYVVNGVGILTHENAILMDENIVVFGSCLKIPNEYIQYNLLYAKVYNLRGEAETEWIKLDSIYSYSNFNLDDYEITLSKDKSAFSVRALLYNSSKTEVSVRYTLYNTDLKRVYRKKIILSGIKGRAGIEIANEIVSGNNSIYFLVKNHAIQSFYRVASTDKDTLETDNLAKYQLSYNYFILPVAFEDSTGNITMLNVYTGKNSDKVAFSGVSYAVLDRESLVPIKNKTIKFDNEFLENFPIKNISDKREVWLRATVNYLVNENGDITIFVENLGNTSICRGPLSGPGLYCDEVYNRNQLLIVGIKGDGTLKYSKIIKKYSKASIPENWAASYSAFEYGNKIYIFYNDHYQNHFDGNEKIRDLPGYKKRVFVNAVINKDGQMTERIIFRDKEQKLTALTKYHLKTREGNAIFLAGKKGSNMRLLKVTPRSL